ncbi:MAG: hypothetical protein O2898_10020, partial [Proteobacteria bacterium]|nr:hypothetical protein [Pseudomonadota bacterium]
MGLSPAVRAAALGAVAAVIAGVFYTTGMLGPRDAAPAPQAAALPQAEAPVATTPAPVTETPAGTAATETQPETPPAEAQPEAPVAETTAEAPTEEAQPETPLDQPAAAPQETAAALDPEPAAQVPAPQAEAAPLSAPRFDVVRAAPDGMIVIAGQSAPGSLVTVLLDGSDLDSVSADAGGEFVAILALTPSDRARVLTLRATLGDQTALS